MGCAASTAKGEVRGAVVYFVARARVANVVDCFLRYFFLTT
jgi:hypothetical protein